MSLLITSETLAGNNFDTCEAVKEALFEMKTNPYRDLAGEAVLRTLLEREKPSVVLKTQPPLFYRSGITQWSWPGDLRQHMQGPPHNLSKEQATTMSAEELMKLHNSEHNSTRVQQTPQRVYQATQNRTYNQNCPGGNCPNPTIQNRQRIFQWRGFK